MSTPHPIPSIFDTYNAKWLSPSEVAESFVAPPQFAQIVKRSNTLIVGPRGSGKTTLLKMLQEAARDAWRGNQANRLRSRIDYTGVFIATDVTWNSQVSALGDDRLSAESRGYLQMAAFMAHVHKSLVKAMESRAQRLWSVPPEPSIEDRREQEARMVMELMDMWKLAPRVPSFYSVKAALRVRLQHVHEVAAALTSLGPAEQGSQLNKVPYLRIPLFVSCRNAVEQFNDAFDDQDHFWAFLFDELELMPASIRQELFQCLRTLPERVLFKLALTPFDEDVPGMDAQSSAQAGHDYDFVPLWFSRKRKAYKFCRQLWDGMVKSSPLSGISPEDALDQSLLDTDTKAWASRGTAYTNGGAHHKYIKDLCSQDPTFAAYLKSHNIEPGNIEAVRGTRRASTLRKVFPLVVARVEHSKAGPEGPNGGAPSRLRSRKISMIYCGATSLFDVSEGNPRVFKGLVGRLLERLPDGATYIKKDIQADEISQAIGRFIALLRTIVVPGMESERFPKGMLSLLDPIARRMQRNALVDPFSAEPPASFVVDLAIGDAEVRMIGYAMNAGAIVYVPDKEGEEELLSMSRVRTRRFRLSYLFAAQYGIVPRLGRRVTLRELRSGDTSPELFPDAIT